MALLRSAPTGCRPVMVPVLSAGQGRVHVLCCPEPATSSVRSGPCSSSGRAVPVAHGQAMLPARSQPSLMQRAALILPSLTRHTAFTTAIWLVSTGMAKADLEAAPSSSAATTEDLDAVAAALNPDAGSNQFAIGVLFYAVIGFLAIVTLGVAYIQISSFLDQRQEKEDREKGLVEPPTPVGRRGESEVVVRARTREAKREKKGFGNFDD